MTLKQPSKKEHAIGIFDSGIGGLTVLKQLRKILPNENLIYFGDTARIPYGTKSKQLVTQYAVEDSYFLLQHNVKMIVIACNTASAMALKHLKKVIPVPVVGVVVPGAEAAVNKSKNERIGVVGTSATINSQAYKNAIDRHSENKMEKSVFSQACPLLVPITEEGWLDNKITDNIIEEYLKEILQENIDTLILGCTHYPLLTEAFKKVVGKNIELIDSGKETAYYVKDMLTELDLLNTTKNKATVQYYVSDIPQKFEEIGALFLGEPLRTVKRVNFESFLLENGHYLEKLQESSQYEY